MTTGGVGHPDWQAYTNWRGDFVYDGAMTIPSGLTSIGSFVTTNWATLHIDLLSFTTDVIFEIEWFADSAGTEDIDTDSIFIPGGAEAKVLLPVKGNLADISVFNQAAGSGDISLSIEPTNVAVNKRTYLDSPMHIGGTNLTINHGVTTVTTGHSIVAGPAYIDYVPHDSAGNVTVDVFGKQTATGLEFRLASLGKPTVEVFRSFIVPECQVAVRLINSSATVNEVYDLGLTVLSQ